MGPVKILELIRLGFIFKKQKFFSLPQILTKMSIFDECSLSTERPLGTPLCSVRSLNDTELQYQCQWLEGSPPAQLSIPVLSNSSSGAGFLSLNVMAVNTLDGKTVTCHADHPVEKIKCDMTARKSWNLSDLFEVVHVIGYGRSSHRQGVQPTFCQL